MPTTMAVTTLKKGSNLRLLFTITSNNEGDQINTQEITVDDLAKVRFNFQLSNKYSRRRNNQNMYSSTTPIYSPTSPTYSPTSPSYRSTSPIYCVSKDRENTSEYCHLIKISTRKQNMEIELKVKMHVTCKALNYSKDLVCSENWTEYMEMGEVSAHNVYEDRVFSSEFDVSIIVNKVKTIGFAKLYNDTDFTDFHLSTSDGSVEVHRACLGAHSDVFRTMLTSKWKETEEGCIELKGVSVQTLQHLKAYMYLGVLPDDHELCPLLLLASQYMIQELKEQCITRLAQTVKPDNLKSLMDFAIDNKMTDLSVAITQLTPDDVVHGAHEMIKRKISQTSPEELPSSLESKKRCT